MTFCLLGPFALEWHLCRCCTPCPSLGRSQDPVNSRRLTSPWGAVAFLLLGTGQRCRSDAGLHGCGPVRAAEGGYRSPAAEKHVSSHRVAFSCSKSPYGVQTGHKLMAILLSQSPERHDYRHVPPCLAGDEVLRSACKPPVIENMVLTEQGRRLPVTQSPPSSGHSSCVAVHFTGRAICKLQMPMTRQGWHCPSCHCG